MVAPSIQNVDIRLVEQVREIAIATDEGRLVGDTQPMVNLLVQVVSMRGPDRQYGSQSKAARVGLDFYAEGKRTPEVIGRCAAERAVRAHEAVDAPAGFLPIVLAPGDSGILLHEAVGHGLEADFNRKRLSIYSDRIGQPVASSLCTILDDGTLLTRRGSLNVDDEGHEAQCNVLIEGGVLRGYMQDWISARHYGLPPSGNGRRQDVRTSRCRA